MKLSAPIPVLKSQAKGLKKSLAIPMTEALDRVARKEGYASWSLLQSKSDEIFPTRFDEILGFMNPGDLALVGGRPSIGKTSFAIGLFVQAIRKVTQARHFLFSLELTHADVARRIAAYDPSIREDEDRFILDYSDDISADYILARTKGSLSRGSLLVVDYLQLLDQRRDHPSLQAQVKTLKAYAKDQGCVLLFISQLSRAIELRADRRPTLEDIRLPNPLDLGLFNKILLLHRTNEHAKEAEVAFFRPREHRFNVSWTSELSKFH